MNECLAAALVRMTGFDGTGVFVDPMCGSGTIALEAALLACNKPPGLLRDAFGFMRWRDYDRNRWNKLLSQASAEVVQAPEATIIASDHDSEAVAAARRNAEVAGVEIRFYSRRFDELRSAFDEETERRIAAAFDRRLVMNPPYGERMAVDDEASLYRSIGDTLKQDFAGFTAWVITASQTGRKNIGLRHSQSLPLYSGGLECRLRRYEMH
jgi:putative N6-adenine-specific DNA methylase